MTLYTVYKESSSLRTRHPACPSPKVPANDARDGWEYLSSLRTLKKTFREGNDGGVVLDTIRANFGPGPVSFLDVGCADGLFVRRAKDLLHLTGIKLSVTAIDPLPAAVLSTVRQLPVDAVYRTRFEDFSPGAKFDVINVRHSLYYLRDPVRQVARMTDLVKPGGLLTFTLWGRNCDLYRVYGATRTESADADPYPITAEDLGTLVKGNTSLCDVRCCLSIGGINLSAWRGSEDVLRSVYLVLRRQLDPPVRDGDVDLFRSRFERLTLTGQRIVAVITCRKVA